MKKRLLIGITFFVVIVALNRIFISLLFSENVLSSVIRKVFIAFLIVWYVWKEHKAGFIMALFDGLFALGWKIYFIFLGARPVGTDMVALFILDAVFVGVYIGLSYVGLRESLK